MKSKTLLALSLYIFAFAPLVIAAPPDQSKIEEPPKTANWGPIKEGLTLAGWLGRDNETIQTAMRNASSAQVTYCDYFLGDNPSVEVYGRIKQTDEWIPIEHRFPWSGLSAGYGPADVRPLRVNESRTIGTLRLVLYKFPATWTGRVFFKIKQNRLAPTCEKGVAIESGDIPVDLTEFWKMYEYVAPHSQDGTTSAPALRPKWKDDGEF